MRMQDFACEHKMFRLFRQEIQGDELSTCNLLITRGLTKEFWNRKQDFATRLLDTEQAK